MSLMNFSFVKIITKLSVPAIMSQKVFKTPVHKPNASENETNISSLYNAYNCCFFFKKSH